MSLDIVNFVILDLDGKIVAQESKGRTNLGESDLVFRLAISRVAKNLMQKTMSLSYRGVDYYFHRKNSIVLIFGTCNIPLDKSKIRQIINDLLEDRSYTLLLARAGIGVGDLAKKMGEFLTEFADELYQGVKYHSDIAGVPNQRIGNLESH